MTPNSSSPSSFSSVTAVVIEVLPKSGMAYLEDRQGRVWMVTRSCTGPGLESMQVGEAFRLTLAQFDHQLFVRSYQRQP